MTALRKVERMPAANKVPLNTVLSLASSCALLAAATMQEGAAARKTRQGQAAAAAAGVRTTVGVLSVVSSSSVTAVDAILLRSSGRSFTSMSLATRLRQSEAGGRGRRARQVILRGSAAADPGNRLAEGLSQLQAVVAAGHAWLAGLRTVCASLPQATAHSSTAGALCCTSPSRSAA